MACACSTLGAYAEWIGEHPEPWLERSLQLVALGLTTGSRTASFATMALKDLARECSLHLAPFAPSILNTIGQTLQNVAPGSGEGLRLMYAAGKLLNTLPSVEQQLLHIDATLGLCIMKIQELLEQPLFVARSAVTNQLKMATMFFSTLEGSIGKTVLEGFLPLFNRIIVHPEWSQDNSTLEAMHTCAQRSLSSLLHPEIDARPLLPILATSYKIWPHPAALNLLRQLVLLFGRDPDNIIGPVLAELSSITLSGVKACKSVQGDLSDWSELMEAYLGVLAQICKKNARMLLQIPDQIPEMLQCGKYMYIVNARCHSVIKKKTKKERRLAYHALFTGIACLTLPQTGTTKSAGIFLNNAIMQSPHLQTFVQPIGQELVSVILHCIGEYKFKYTFANTRLFVLTLIFRLSETMPYNSLEPHAEVLLALNKTCPEWTAQWLRVALENLTSPVLPQQKENFTRNVLRERTNRVRLWEVLKEFKIGL